MVNFRGRITSISQVSSEDSRNAIFMSSGPSSVASEESENHLHAAACSTFFQWQEFPGSKTKKKSKHNDGAAVTENYSSN